MDTLHFLYHTAPGRALLKVLTRPGISRLCGRFLDSGMSRFLIAPFVRHNAIQLSDYDLSDIHSFNDFFSRKIRKGKRCIDFDPRNLIAPCDGLLSVFKITDTTVFPIKQSHYTLQSLLRSKKLASRYRDGYCLVFRLCVDHYHRYCYIDSGKKSKNYRIPGILHTVRPVALRQTPVFCENSREFTLIRTPHFGTVVQMEVGAMLVGRIVNYKEADVVARGEEKGMFQYGGSTIIVLLPKDQAVLRSDLLTSSKHGKETTVRMGEVIGYAAKN